MRHRLVKSGRRELGIVAEVGVGFPGGAKEERMTNVSDNSTGGLVEGVGQELKPYGPQSNTPPQPQDGQWTFRYNYADTSKVIVLVTVTFGAPFALTAELSSEMTKTQVESLKDWLTRIFNAMNGKSQ